MPSAARSGRPGRKACACGAPDRLLTPVEAARQLGISPGTLKNWAREGRIRSYPLSPHHGARRRYSEREVTGLVELIKSGESARPPRTAGTSAGRRADVGAQTEGTTAA
ncbi:helix-turn-helix domain-containing protein [Streptomyces sp. NPDC048483]|uniref:helix-turn-helix domain-containing protein n=1 Tax=Streptomyces sp. NPDC048483 TaxID=3154927 RepID=UPI003418CE53